MWGRFKGWRRARIQPDATEAGASMVEYAMMGGFLAVVAVFMMMLVGNVADSHLAPILEVGSQVQVEDLLQEAARVTS